MPPPPFLRIYFLLSFPVTQRSPARDTLAFFSVAMTPLLKKSGAAHEFRAYMLIDMSKAAARLKRKETEKVFGAVRS